MSVPDSVVNYVDVLRMDGVEGLDATALWLDASWRAAQIEGIGEEEFMHWLEVGLWNLAGDTAVLEKVGVYRMIAGVKGWILGAAEFNVEEALKTFYEFGPVTVLNNAKTLIALKGLADKLPVEDRDVTEEPPEGVDSSLLDLS